MEKRALVATVLSLLVMIVWSFLWQKFYVTPRQEVLKRQQKLQQEVLKPSPALENSGGKQEGQSSPVSQQVLSSQIISQPVNMEASDVTIETSLMRVVLTTQGARIKSWQILKHKDTKGNPVELVSEVSSKLNRYPFEVLTGDTALNTELNFGLFTASKGALQLSETNKIDSVELRYENQKGLILTKNLTFYHDIYAVDVELTLHSVDLTNSGLSLTWGPGLGGILLDDQTPYDNAIVSAIQNKVTRESVSKLKDATHAGNIQWAAIDRRYFTAALLPTSPNNILAVELLPIPGDNQDKTAISVDQVVLKVDQPGLEGIKYKVYVGPKEYNGLAGFKVGLEQVLDYGYFGSIVKAMVLFMRVIYDYTHNYGVAIIILTVLVKLIFYPLTHMSFKSMKKMQTMQPKVMEIREKYRKDPTLMNQKLMELYKAEGANPMGGCLPMILQIPVFYALYVALSVSVELRGASFLWIPDLSAPEPYKILVILMGGTMFIQQSMTPTTGDPRQAQIFKFMPIIFTAMFWNFHAGLVLYWLVNNVLSIGQQYLINKGDITDKKAVSGKKKKVSKG
jgi:YidC/Oxa1 family membrane protein insertase